MLVGMSVLFTSTDPKLGAKEPNPPLGGIHAGGRNPKSYTPMRILPSAL
jgi:hypothetical protein